MTTGLQLLDRLDRTFEGGGEGYVARRLLSFLAVHPDTTHITLQLVHQISAEPSGTPATQSASAVRSVVSDAVAVRALQFLSAGANNVLEAKFELIEDDREDVAPYILSDEEVRAVLTEGINPISGEHDPDISRKVVIFFAPTVNMTPLLAEYGARGGAE